MQSYASRIYTHLVRHWGLSIADFHRMVREITTRAIISKGQP